MRALLFPVPFLLLAGAVRSQSEGTAERIEILGGDEWKFDQKIAPGAQRLVGHARFKHEGAVMSCDSAYIYEDQTVTAFGHVVIIQGDTLRISGDRLDYIGRIRSATLTGAVKLNDADMELTTEHLVYDMRSRVATYADGGTIVSHKEHNTLTSRRGSYLAMGHKFIFSDEVLLQHPERTITSDTLHYTTTSGLAEFFGPTTIVAQGTRMWCTRGSYDTRNEFARFQHRARILNKDQELQGDSLHYDRRSGVGLAWGNVVVLDTTNGMKVIGERGRHDEAQERSWVTGRAELMMVMGGDTLHLHGDTLHAMPDSIGRKIIARRGVRFFKSDLQGACDTMIYSDADSTIRLLSSPVLWSGDDQITGTRIRITLQNGKAHRLYVDDDAFLCSQVDSTRYDQVTGSKMTGYFKQSELDHLIAEGNCRTVYFPREEQKAEASIDSMTVGAPATIRLIGMNRVDCSRIDVRLNEGDVDGISFLARPDGTMYPLEKAPAEEMVLRGFHWRGAERPGSREELFP